MRRCIDKLEEEVRGLTSELLLKVLDLGAGGAIGSPSVAVECVEMRRNTRGEGGVLDCN